MNKEMEENTNQKDSIITRRSLLLNAGKVAVGTALVTSGCLSASSPTQAKKETEYPWPYEQIDPDRAAEIAYQNWYGNYCAYASASGILVQLKEKVGYPYTVLPVDIIRFAHGGVVGWGTLCGTMAGAGIAASLAAGHDGDEMINDLLAYYANTELPIYMPKEPKLAKAPLKNKSDSPLCHISVGKWMKKTGHAFKSPERKDRCARLAGDVSKQMAMMLNAYYKGEYEAQHYGHIGTYNMTAQDNCTSCHTSNVPSPPQMKM
ncbi:MAG: C_GCAxxG_C_C family protein [Nitrospirota bacterium]|nr:MAG: C_GCAxxG_C_C family protein [Nitrospirota bacterium]